MVMEKQVVFLPRHNVPGGKEIAKQIFREAMTEIDVRRAMLRKVRRDKEILIAGDVFFPLPSPPLVIAFGKAATSMANALAEILDGDIERGIVVGPSAPVRKNDRFTYFTGGHPYPTSGSLAGAEAALELLRGRWTGDSVVFLVSGGGSALFEKPLDPQVTLANLVEFNRLLVTCGLPIEKINVLRKHFSAVKGGRLAVAAHPAEQLTIYVSDVPEGRDSMVGSGPTMPDESTADECSRILKEMELAEKLPRPILRRFIERSITETPKPGDHRFTASRYFCLLSNADAVKATKSAAERAGFVCDAAPQPWDADYREVADRTLASLERLSGARRGQRVALVSGGEVTCPLTGPGMGGRNQAYVLHLAQKMAGRKLVALSAGTDGRDGNSPACGAVADGQTISRAAALGLDPQQYLAESDSYSFFRTLGDTIDIGFTDNNVRDLRLLLDFNGD
jgi:glycerate 2-kinase